MIDMKTNAYIIPNKLGFVYMILKNSSNFVVFSYCFADGFRYAENPLE